MRVRAWIIMAWMVACGAVARAGAEAVGIFADQSDVGAATAAGTGSARFDAASKSYAVSGAGANIWASADAFHFVWTKVKADQDVSLTANVEFAAATAGAEMHRKAVLMIRQSLDADSPYADACVHGNGMTAIQWRDAKGGLTYETQAQADGPPRLRIEKRGDFFSASFGTGNGDLQPMGGACKIAMSGEMYVGIGVCPHNSKRQETAKFSNVELNDLAAASAERTRMISTLETVQISSGDRRAVCVIAQPGLKRAEAPNWASDDMLYFNNGGRMFKIKADRPSPAPPKVIATPPAPVDLGPLSHINNDHGISPDGKWLAVSDQTAGKGSAVWIVPIEGVGDGVSPRCITDHTPSYFHGWSPDGQTLAFCGLREKNFDIYTIGRDGGAEKRLTDSPGKDDGPEFSPDGQFIYFNSDRTGSMQIWRMKRDGSEQTQITNDAFNNWFPHLSPDGRWLAFLSYEAGVVDHPENKDVQIRLMDVSSGTIRVLAKLFGGQGTMNVDSWSRDGRYLAFMSYQIVPQ